MKTIIYLLSLSIIILCVASCTASPRQKTVKQWMQDNGKLKVLSTTGMVNDLVKAVGGDAIDSFTLIDEQLDPHSYQLVKGDDEKFRRADVVFYSGLNLEHGPSLQATLKKHPNAHALGDIILQSDPKKILYINGQIDPHIWMDMSLWAESIPSIVAVLSKAKPDQAAIFADNGKQLQQQLKEAHQKIRSKLQSIPSPKRYLVTSHDAFNYFARAYLADDKEIANNSWQERFAAPEGLAPDSQLSASHIQEIINHLDKFHIMVLFPESNVSKDSIRKIVDAGREKGLVLSIANESLYGDAMGPEGSEGDSYQKMLMYNAEVLEKHLKNNGAEARHAALLRVK